MVKGLFSQKTEQFLRGLYETFTPLSELLSGIDLREFSWIGTGKGTFFDSQDDLRKWWKKQHMDRERPERSMKELQITEQPLSETVTVVLARWKLTGEGEAVNQYRATFVYFHRGSRTALEHIHLSRPWTLLWGHETFPITACRINYEYIVSLRRAENIRGIPRVPARQRRVLYYLRTGMTYREIGEIMEISPRTVRYYVSELIRRFRVENRAQLLEAGLALSEEENEIERSKKS